MLNYQRVTLHVSVMNWKLTCLKPHFQDNLLEAATVRRTHLLDGGRRQANGACVWCGRQFFCKATGYRHGTPFLSSWTSPSSWPTLLIRGCRQPDLTGLVRLSRLGVSDGLVPHKEPHVMSCWSRWHLQTGMAHDIFCQQIDWRWPFKDTKHFVCDCQRCTDDCDPCRGFRRQSLPKVVCFESCAVGFLSRNSCFSKVSCGVCLGLCPVDTCKNDDFGPWLGTPGRCPRCLSASLKLGACGDEVSNGWGSENRSLGNRFVRRSPPHTRSTCKCVRVRSSFDQRMDCVSISLSTWCVRLPMLHSWPRQFDPVRWRLGQMQWLVESVNTVRCRDFAIRLQPFWWEKNRNHISNR